MMRHMKSILEISLEKDHIAAAVEGRIKEIASIEKTLERRNDHLSKKGKSFKKLDDIIFEMHDLCGLRIVLEFTDPETHRKAEQLIERKFKKNKEPAKFGPNRSVGKVWNPEFGSYETHNHRVVLEEDIKFP